MKSLVKEFKEIDEYWNDLLFHIAGKDPGKIRELQRFDVYDFFAFVDNSLKK